MAMKHIHHQRCSLCGIWPSTSWCFSFDVEHCGQGFHFEGDICHVCEGCARSNRHLKPVSCTCLVQPEPIQWHRILHRGIGGITCTNCYKSTNRVLWWHRDFAVYDPVTKQTYVLRMICTACKKLVEGSHDAN